MHSALARSTSFCSRYHLKLPILLAPMAGVPSPTLSIAVMNAGGLGSCGALLMQPDEIRAWANEVRAHTSGPFQINLWVPDPPPQRDAAHEARVREFLAQFGPTVPESAGNATPPNFCEQCEALLEIAPPIVSSVMGIYFSDFVQRLKQRGISYWANISTVAEAKIAEAAGADVIVAQGAEAGGHRGSFDAAKAVQQQVGLFSLLPAVVDAVKIPVVATGGIADARGVAAAFLLGASAVQLGTAFLRSPESKIPSAWANALGEIAPEDTVVTRAFSGRPGRAIATGYIRAATAPDAPAPAPYPVQRALTAAMRAEAMKANDLQRMQSWAGQSARLGKSLPAADLVRSLWADAQALLS